MPVETSHMSRSQFCELLGIEPSRLFAVAFNRLSSTVTISLEPQSMTQTSGVFPQLNTKGTKVKAPKGGKKKGC